MTEIEKEPQRGFCAAQSATTRSENTANRLHFASSIHQQKQSIFVKDTFIHEHSD